MPSEAAQFTPNPIPDNANEALVHIRRMIDAGDCEADGRLPTERELCERLGVGRRAVRCALEVLEAEGLIWRRQGKGTFIGLPPDPTGVLAAEMVVVTDALSVMEARLCIEPNLAALAAERARPEDVARMRDLAERIGAPPDAETAELWDGALHRLIARTAGNPILLTAFTLVDEVRMREDWQAMRHRARSVQKVQHYEFQHRGIIEAIARNDPERAREAMTQHLTLLLKNLKASLEGEAE